MMTPNEAKAKAEKATEKRKRDEEMFLEKLYADKKIHKRINDAIENAANHGEYQVMLNLIEMTEWPELPLSMDRELEYLRVIARWVEELGFKTKINYGEFGRNELVISW